jgi:hypothetical protein
MKFTKNFIFIQNPKSAFDGEFISHSMSGRDSCVAISSHERLTDVIDHVSVFIFVPFVMVIYATVVALYDSL